MSEGLSRLAEGTRPGIDEQALVEGLRRRDEGAFRDLIELYGASMLRLARSFVAAGPLAEQVVEDALLGVLDGINHAGRPLRLRVLELVAAAAAARSAGTERDAPPEPAVDPGRFRHPQYPGGWSAPPRAWPGGVLEGRAARAAVERAIAALPPAQRQVITLRDVEGLSAAQTSETLALAEREQRALLHQARSRVRGALEQELGRQ